MYITKSKSQTYDTTSHRVVKTCSLGSDGTLLLQDLYTVPRFCFIDFIKTKHYLGTDPTL